MCKYNIYIHKEDLESQDPVDWICNPVTIACELDIFQKDLDDDAQVARCEGFILAFHPETLGKSMEKP